MATPSGCFNFDFAGKSGAVMPFPRFPDEPPTPANVLIMCRVLLAVVTVTTFRIALLPCQWKERHRMQNEKPHRLQTRNLRTMA